MHVEILDDVALSPNAAHHDSGTTCFLPCACRLPGGAVVCTYRQGRQKYSPDGVMVAQTSGDGGLTWSAPAVILDRRTQDPPESVHGGVVGQVADGALVSIFTTLESQPEGTFAFSAAGKQLRSHLYVCRSRDGGRTWSAPREHHLVGTTRNTYIGSRPLLRADGTLVLPVEGISEKGEEINYVTFSRDGAESFSPASECARDPEAKTGYGDVRLAELPDGKLVILLWTWVYATEETLNVHRCVSADGGLTWSAPARTNVRCQILSPAVYGDGTLVAVGNVRWPPAPGVYLWVSRSAGRKWNAATPVLMWDGLQERLVGKALRPAGAAMTAAQEKIWQALPGFTFGTPEVTYLEKNLFLLTYYAMQDKVMQIRACRFALDL
jgi:hypothetical protein